MSPRTSRITTALMFMLGGIACAAKEAESDPVLKQLTVGITRDSALRIIGAGATGDSLANVYRQERYLFDGLPLEILFYSRDGLREGQGAAAPESTLRPIVINLGRVTGWGWAYFDSVARVHDIRARVR